MGASSLPALARSPDHRGLNLAPDPLRLRERSLSKKLYWESTPQSTTESTTKSYLLSILVQLPKVQPYKLVGGL